MSTPLYKGILGVAHLYNFVFLGRVYIKKILVAFRFRDVESDDVIDVPLSFFPSTTVYYESPDSTTLFPYPAQLPLIALNENKGLYPSGEGATFSIEDDWSCKGYTTIFYPNVCYRTKDITKENAETMDRVSSLIYDTDFIQCLGIAAITSFYPLPNGNIRITTKTMLNSVGYSAQEMRSIIVNWLKKNGIPIGDSGCNVDLAFGQGEYCEMNFTFNKNILFQDFATVPKKFEDYSLISCLKVQDYNLSVSEKGIITVQGWKNIFYQGYPNCPKKEYKEIACGYSRSKIEVFEDDEYRSAAMSYEKVGNDLVFRMKFLPIFNYERLQEVRDLIMDISLSSFYIQDIATNKYSEKTIPEIRYSNDLGYFSLMYRVSADMTAYGTCNKRELMSLIQKDIQDIINAKVFESDTGVVAKVFDEGKDDILTIIISF